MENKNKNTAEARYQVLKTERESFLSRARKCAELTIPTLVPHSGANSSTNFATPYQSIGARAVNYLASRFLLTLLPPNSPFYRLKVDEDVEIPEGQKAEVEQGLTVIEALVMNEIEQLALRVAAYETLKHLIVAGNTLIYLDPDKDNARVFHLSSYVVSRDPMDALLEIITHEKISPSTLPQDVLKFLADGSHDKLEALTKEKTLNLYRHVKRVRNQWISYEEINGKELPKTRAIYPLEGSPWLPLRFIKVDGESYGRSYVEQYYGDLHSTERLSKAIVEASVAASRILLLIEPNGITRAKDIQEAENGDAIKGSRKDVNFLQLDKFADLKTASSTLDQLIQRLATAFLMHSSVQRDAERVTAEEIRYMAQELETALGGVYSILSQEFQMPLVRVLLMRLQRKGRIPPLFNKVKPYITTGLEALGRGQDLEKVLRWFEILKGNLSPEEFQKEIKSRNFIERTASFLSINSADYLKTNKEKNAEAEQQENAANQQAMQEALTRAAPQVANNLTKGE
ncbi:portal protein [Zooshikella sp. RANM57]|uniref:portal protein n=1 Tax=Zooshikella sp. RANM57 TaxID=3425863 RepID=UPI003D6F07A0